MSESEWHTAKNRYRVGSEVTAEITAVTPGNREYFVTFDGLWSGLFWSGTPPIESGGVAGVPGAGLPVALGADSGDLSGARARYDSGYEFLGDFILAARAPRQLRAECARSGTRPAAGPALPPRIRAGRSAYCG